MTHESERTYHERVREYLVEQYGEENVESTKYLDETGRFADFWVEGPVVTLAVEVENDWEAVSKGIGQATLYSAHDDDAVPVVIVPPGHVEYPEVEMLRERIAIIELDV